MDVEPSGSGDDSDTAMLAGMEGLIAAMKDRRSAPELVDPLSSTEVRELHETDGVLAAAPWRAVGRPSSSGDDEPFDDEPLRGLSQGEVVGRYVVIKKLGAGAMGVVYAAFDPELDRKVALKLLQPGLHGDEGRERLLREAQALGKLAHPNIVAVHDVGTVGELQSNLSECERAS